MSTSFIVDAHLHLGDPGGHFTPESHTHHLMRLMDKLYIQYGICCGDLVSLREGVGAGVKRLQKLFDDESQGRIFFLGVYAPNCPDECLNALKATLNHPGFVGIKIHPSFHRVPAEHDLYEHIWQFAQDHDLPILSHTWSPSAHNPLQALSSPERFEPFIAKFPDVRFIIAHAGGRGAGRQHAIRLINEYPNVYLDFSGDVFCYELIEDLVKSVSSEKLLFGSDVPWIDPRAHLCRVLFADIAVSIKEKILRENAMHVYRLGRESC